MRLCFIGAIVLLIAPTTGAEELTLASGGQPIALVRSFGESTEAELFAKAELNRYLKQISSANFVVKPTSAQSAWIVLSRQSAPGLDTVQPPLPKLNAEGYALAVRGKQIYLIGADDRGVWYAVYAFLERLGCRWLAPAFAFYDGHHESVPTSKELRFSLSEDFVDRPALAFRKLYVEEGHSHNAENLKQLVEWMPKLRFNTLVVPINYQGRDRVRWDNWREALTPELKRRGIIIEVGGHGYQNFLNAGMDQGLFFTEHTEWFGKNERGKRTPQQNRVICTLNHHAVGYLQQNVLKYLKEHPEIEIFDFWPPDGAAWCTCEPCKKLGSPSQRHALLVAQTAQVVKRERSGVRVECIAYSSYLEPPSEIPFDKSVLVDFCPISQSFERQINDPESQVNAGYAEALKGWLEKYKGDISIYSYYRKYAWASLPIIIPHYMQNDLRFYQQAGVHGISSYAEPGDWFTYELNHYVLGHLAWNPDVNVDDLIREFCTARYGLAAKFAEKALSVLEEVTRRACSIPSTSLKSPAEYKDFADKIDAMLQGADVVRQAHERDPVLVAHLMRLRLMLEYAARDIAIQRLRAEKAPRAEIQARVDELAEFLKKNADEGVFLWHQRLEPAGQYKRYGLAKK